MPTERGPTGVLWNFSNIVASWFQFLSGQANANPLGEGRVFIRRLGLRVDITPLFQFHERQTPVQGRFVESLTTCVVIPLVGKEYFSAATVLNPVIMINGVGYLLSTAEITAVLRKILGLPVTSVQAQHSEIIAAIDRLLL